MKVCGPHAEDSSSGKFPSKEVMVFGRQGRGRGEHREPWKQREEGTGTRGGWAVRLLSCSRNTSHSTEDLKHQFKEIELDSRVANMWP